MNGPCRTAGRPQHGCRLTRASALNLLRIGRGPMRLWLECVYALDRSAHEVKQ